MNRILAVDDSASMRQMVAFTLSSAGFNVAEAPDGVVALQMAQKEKFKLVLADVNMPNMDGISLRWCARCGHCLITNSRRC
jgi:two-component system chemotaxis response regulator CheY